MQFMATAVKGLEDVAGAELRELGAEIIRKAGGRVEFRGSLETLYKTNLAARCINRVFIIIHRANVECLDDIYRECREVDYSWIISKNQSFGVRAKRIGEHPFKSPEIASTVGRAITESFAESEGERLKVNLDMPDVEFHALLREKEFILTVNTTGDSLHKRGYREYQHYASIKTTLASSLIKFSGWKPSFSFLDPMCGGGTIPIEAVLMAKKKTNTKDFAFRKLKIHNEELYVEIARRMKEKEIEKPNVKIAGMDISSKHLEGAIRNAKNAGVLSFIEFIRGDARKLSKYIKFSPEFIVVNPPYGIRSSRKRIIGALYRDFLRSLREISCGSTLTAVTAAIKEFKSACEANEIEITEERSVMYGNLPAEVFKCSI